MKKPWAAIPLLRGFTVQLFAITLLPLTLLLLLIAFGSISMHQQDMRSLVSKRDARAVQSASAALEAELHHREESVSAHRMGITDRGRLAVWHSSFAASNPNGPPGPGSGIPSYPARIVVWCESDRAAPAAVGSEGGRARLGDFETIEEPVGGISEVQHLQKELTEMARKVQSAQEGLHDFIGTITAAQEEARARPS